MHTCETESCDHRAAPLMKDEPQARPFPACEEAWTAGGRPLPGSTPSPPSAGSNAARRATSASDHRAESSGQTDRRGPHLFSGLQAARKPDRTPHERAVRTRRPSSGHCGPNGGGWKQAIHVPGSGLDRREGRDCAGRPADGRKPMRVGVLTGGGDCPGLNAVIRSVVRKGVDEYAFDFVGLRDGWLGLLQDDVIPLDIASVRGILPAAEPSLAPPAPTRSHTRTGCDAYRTPLPRTTWTRLSRSAARTRSAWPPN